MSKLPSVLAQLIVALQALPGIGPKTAHRMTFHLLQNDKSGAERLARALDLALTGLMYCRSCNIFSEAEYCELCSDSTRRQDQLCIVETPADVLTLEQAKCFDGLYFVLMGRLSPLDNVGPSDIHLTALRSRIRHSQVTEVVIATNFTAEGEITAHLISEMLKPCSIQVTRIARGMPVGGELEYVDLGTLAQAVYERRKMP